MTFFDIINFMLNTLSILLKSVLFVMIQKLQIKRLWDLKILFEPFECNVLF